MHISDREKPSMQVRADADSPWFNGHFPNEPILPGIAQLEMVADLVSQVEKQTKRVAGLSRVKFKKIVRPGDLLDIRATPGDKKGRYSFTIRNHAEEVCSGIVLLAPNDTTITDS